MSASKFLQKRPLSLLELAIGLSLTAILLSSLFASFRQIARQNNLVQKAHATVHERTFLHLRLQHVFSTIPQENVFQKTEESLTFIYHHPYDLEPSFCGSLRGEIKFKEKELVFLSINQENQRRSQKLFTNLSGAAWEFYDLKTKKWTKEPEKERLPLQAKLHLTLSNQEKLLFIFQCPAGKYR